MKQNLKWMLLILGVVFFFFWKLTLTHQFSVLVWPESSNQAYSWYHFSAASVQQGTLPLWDPYTHAGRTFIGGMETGVFYPLKFILYYWPFSRSGLFSQHAFHHFYVLAHILAACFMFLLAREFGLGLFPSFVASICFSLTGFMSKIAWPDMLDSAIWLPLILLFLLRALNSARKDRAMLLSCVAGLLLGTSLLGGRIHIVVMDGFVILSLAIYATWRRAPGIRNLRVRKSTWLHSFVVVSVVLAIAILLGAVQLLPSIEYSDLAVRYIGADFPPRVHQKISYFDLHGELWPRSLMALLFVSPFPGGNIGTEGFSPYFGVLPLILTIFGVWRNWQNLWVRYLAVLATLAFFYTLGSYSFLHGLLYSTVPYLWVAREACRLTYLMHFATAILAGFGVQALFCPPGAADEGLARFTRALWWIAAVITAIMTVPAIYGKPEVNEWLYYSLLFILASVAAFAYVSRGHRTQAAAFVLAAVILSDFHGSYWIIQNIKQTLSSGSDYLHSTLLKSGDLANFLKSKPGIFRVRMEMDGPPNIGDLYGVQITECMMATELQDYTRMRLEVPRAYDLLNARYIVKRNDTADPNPVYADALWKVYENQSAVPRAWIVREVSEAQSQERAFQRIKEPSFDPRRQAVVAGKLESALDPQQVNSDDVRIESYQAQRIDLAVRTNAPGLLILSEVDFPGWRATVNGAPVPIHKVDGLLRGVVVPAGSSKVMFRYMPASVLWGAILTFIAPLVTLGMALYVRRRARAGSAGVSPDAA